MAECIKYLLCNPGEPSLISETPVELEGENQFLKVVF